MKTWIRVSSFAPLLWALAAISAQAQYVDYVSSMGGPCNTAALRFPHAYIGEGPHLTTLDVSNPAQPRTIARERLAGQVNDIQIVDSLAYVAADTHGLSIYDFSDPAAPARLGTAGGGGDLKQIAVAGNFVYGAGSPTGLCVFEIGNPAFPQLRWASFTPGATSIAIHGNRAYVGGNFSGVPFHIYDISDPLLPVLLGSGPQFPTTRSLATSGDALYTCHHMVINQFPNGPLIQWAFISVWDISNPAAPVEASRRNTGPSPENSLRVFGSHLFAAGTVATTIYTFGGGFITPVGSYPSAAYDIDVQGDRAALAIFDRFEMLDLASPLEPEKAGEKPMLFHASGLDLSGDRLYFRADETNGLAGGIGAVDVSNPALPDQEGFLQLPDGAQAIHGAGESVYGIEGDDIDLSPIRLYDFSNPAAPAQSITYNSGVGLAAGFRLDGNRGYAFGGASGARIFSLGPADTLSLLGEYPGSVTDAEASFGALYVTRPAPGFNRSTIAVVDVSDPGAPIEVGSTEIGARSGFIRAEGRRAYHVSSSLGSAAMEKTLLIIDASDPANPALAGEFALASSIVAFDVEGSIAWLLDSNSDLTLVDVSEAANPALLGGFDFWEGGTLGHTNDGIVVRYPYAYMFDGNEILTILKYSGPLIDAAQGIGHTMPSSLHPGQEINFGVTMLNSGLSSWSGADSYALGVGGPAFPGLIGGEFPIEAGSVVNAEQPHQFTVNLVAPVAPGSYELQFQMRKNGVPFGDAARVEVHVLEAVNAAESWAEYE